MAFISHQRKTHSPIALEIFVIHAMKKCSKEVEYPTPATENNIFPGMMKCKSAWVICTFCVATEGGGQRDEWTHALALSLS